MDETKCLSPSFSNQSSIEITKCKILFQVRWGYNNVRIKKGDKWKAMFMTNHGLFKLTVMLFGLYNSPSTFQMMMNEYFRDMIAGGWLVVYIDDMLIYVWSK